MIKTFSPQSKRYHKARVQVARRHLGVSRQRKDFAVKTARALIQSKCDSFWRNLEMGGVQASVE